MKSEILRLVREACARDAESCEILIADLLADKREAGWSGFVDEFVEDVLIDAVRDGELAENEESAVYSGCARIFADLLRAAALREDAHEMRVAAFRVCRVVDVLHPMSLKPHAEAFFRLMIGWTAAADVLRASARAAAAYASQADLGLWREALECEEIAAYAFGVLIRIDHEARYVAPALKRLWLAELREGWEVDCLFLSRRLARQRGSEQPLATALRSLLDELDGSEVAKLRREFLKQQWSRAWVEYLEHEADRWMFVSSVDEPSSAAQPLKQESLQLSPPDAISRKAIYLFKEAVQSWGGTGGRANIERLADVVRASRERALGSVAADWGQVLGGGESRSEPTVH